MGNRVGYAMLSILILVLGTRAWAQGGPPPFGVPDVEIQSPTDGSATNQGAIDVEVSYASGSGRGNPNVTLIELRVDGALASLFEPGPGQRRGGTHVFPGIDISAGANTGSPVSIVARAFQGNPRKNNFTDSLVVGVILDTLSPSISDLFPSNGSLLQDPAPTLSASILDSGGAGLDSGSIVMAVNAVLVPASVNLLDPDSAIISFTPSPLLEGDNSFSVFADDLAGNSASEATATFTVDFTGPQITITQPADQGTFPTPTVPLDIEISDEHSGVDDSTIVLMLNGDEVTTGLVVTPGDPTTITGNLTASVGANTLLVSVSDNATNQSGGSSNFTVSTVTSELDILNQIEQDFVHPEGEEFEIEIVDGDGQEALTGHPAANPLQVKVTHPVTNDPIPSVPIEFVVTDGGGMFSSGPTFKTMTNDSGLASVIYIAGSIPDTNEITAQVGGVVQQTAVTFSVVGRSPSLTDVTLAQAQARGNCFNSLSEFPGSALRMLLRVQFKDHEGVPREGQVVIPEVQQNGQFASGIGEFIPEQNTTDNQGIATFAFVIDLGAPFGSFDMKFFLPDYFDIDGEFLSHTITGGFVDDPLGGGQPAIIDHNAPGGSGQGQIGLPGQQLAIPLRAISNTGNDVEFSILEGTGSFADGDAGTIREVGFGGPCGHLTARVEPDASTSKASVMFTPGAGTDFILVHINAGTDVFAIVPPLIRFVNPQNPSQVYTFLEVTQDPAGEPDKPFLYEVLMPVNHSGTVRGRIQSFNEAQAPLSVPGGTGQVSLENIQLQSTNSNIAGRYSRWCSDPNQPLFAAEFASFQPQANPVVGSFRGILTVPNGSLVPTLQDPITKRGRRGWVPQIEVDSLFLRRFNVKEDLPRIGPIIGPPVEHPDQAHKLTINWIGSRARPEWSFRNIGGTALTASKTGKGRTLWIRIDDATDTGSFNGRNRRFPIRLGVPYAQANRRARIEIKATLEGRELDFRVKLVNIGPTLREGVALDPASVPLGQTTAILAAQFPFYNEPLLEPDNLSKEPEHGKWIPINGVDPQEDLKRNLHVAQIVGHDNAFQATSLFSRQRLVLGKTSRVLGLHAKDRVGTVLGFTVEEASFAFDEEGGTLADGDATLRWLYTYGSAIMDRGQAELDLTDLGFIVGHEQSRALTDLVLSDSLKPGSTTTPPLDKAIFENLIQSYFMAFAPAARNDLDKSGLREEAVEWRRAYAEIKAAIELLEAESPNGAISWYAMEQEMRRLHKSWYRVLRLLGKGRLLRYHAGDFHMNLSGGTRAAILQELQSIFDAFIVIDENNDAILGDFLGGEFDLSSFERKNESKVIFHVMRPEE